MFGAVREGWSDAGAYVLILTSFMVFLGIISRARPVRYAMKAVIGKPISDWIAKDVVVPELEQHEIRMRKAVRDETRTVIREHTTNEESLARELIGTVGHLSAQLEDGVEKLTSRMNQIEAAQIRQAGLDRR